MSQRPVYNTEGFSIDSICGGGWQFKKNGINVCTLPDQIGKLESETRMSLENYDCPYSSSRTYDGYNICLYQTSEFPLPYGE